MNVTQAMSFAFLFIAILFGVLGTICMKLSNGLRVITPTLWLCVFYAISFSAMTLALKHIDLSIVYGIWSGLGTLMVSIIGVFYFNERLSNKKIIFLIFIIIGVIGIHLADYVA